MVFTQFPNIIPRNITNFVTEVSLNSFSLIFRAHTLCYGMPQMHVEHKYKIKSLKTNVLIE